MKRERPRNDDVNGDGHSSSSEPMHENEQSDDDCSSYPASSCTSSLVTNLASGYSTFSAPKSSKPKTQFNDQKSFYRALCSYVDSFTRWNKGSPETSIHPNHHLSPITWRAIAVLSVTFGIVAVLHTKTSNYKYNNTFMAADWYWDHNIYVPKDSSGDLTLPTVSHRNTPASLIAQIVPGTAFRMLEDISSRPNRAYARQWGFDFARYDSGRASNNPRACFDKVAVLNAILDKQSNTTTINSDVISFWSHYPRVQYEYILLLPPDSIVMKLDTNIMTDLLPSGKLVAIAGWSSTGSHHHELNSNSDVIAFNLHHRHAEAVARLWLEMSLSSSSSSQSQVTCGANNDLGMLITAVATVMEESEDLDDLIAPLSESQDGFIGNRVIKSIPSTVPGPRTSLLSTSLQESATLLQQTADSVCYRFYPKCEVLPST